MINLKRSWERAELLIETARQRPNKIKIISTPSTQAKWKSIHQKLAELYIEECGREPKQKYLRNATHLLDKLVARDRLKCLVVNLYPGNEGYSVMLKGRNGMDTETVRLPYEESELLNYIDNEELPPVLVDILDCSQVNMFYSGCVIAEVRDYRRSSYSSTYESHYVLLRPTTQSLICDVNSLTSDGTKWSPEDRMMLESQLLLATQEPLCLEPTFSVALVANYLHHSKHRFGIHPIKNMAKRLSQPVLNRKLKFKQYAAPPCLQLYDFLVNSGKKKSGGSVQEIKPKTEECFDPHDVVLTPPEQVEVLKFATALPSNLKAVENSLDFMEEYTLESKQSNGKGYYCRLTIYLRSLDDEFFGELYTDRDYVEGQMKGAMCRFQLGSRANVDKYLQQYIDIFTQESRKSVKITHETKTHGIVTISVPPGQSVPFPLTNTTDSTLTSPLTLPSTMRTGVLGPSSISLPEKEVHPLKKPAFSKSLQSPVNPNSDNSPKSATSSCGTGSNAAQNGTSSHVLPTGRTGSRQQSNSGQHPLSRPSSVSPGPNVTSPGSTNLQLNPLSTQQKTNVAPRSRTPTSTPVLQNIGLLSRIQPGLAGFISSATNEPGTTLTPVSVTGMTVPPGIAVPISLTVMASTPPNISPAGVLVSPLTSLVACGSTTRPTGPLTHTSVLPVATTHTVTSSIPSTALMATSAVPSGSSVLTSPAAVVSFPVGLTGSLSNQNLTTRFIASNLKGQPVALQPSGSNSAGLLQVANARVGVSNKGTCLVPTTASPSGMASSSSISGGSSLMALNSQQQMHAALQQKAQQLASTPPLQNSRGHPRSSKTKARKRNSAVHQSDGKH